jgi:hypothetical protein
MVPELTRTTANRVALFGRVDRVACLASRRRQDEINTTRTPYRFATSSSTALGEMRG